ncbi:hypothetical protein GIB67_019110, partial [Kingdonia uniflora]
MIKSSLNFECCWKKPHFFGGIGCGIVGGIDITTHFKQIDKLVKHNILQITVGGLYNIS